MNPLLAILAGLGIIHGANGIVHRFEREAAADLAARVWPNRKLAVRSEVGPEAIFGEVQRVTVTASAFHTDRFPLFVEPNRSHHGELHQFRIDMSDFELRSLHVNRLQAEIPDCRFDYAAAVGHHIFRLSESGTGRVEAEVGERDLTAFIRHKISGLDRLDVHIDHDKVFLDGHGTILLFPASFSIVGMLEPVAGTQLRLVHARLILNGKPIDDASAGRLFESFNPVLDLDRDLGLSGAVHADRLELRDGVMKAFGSVKIPTEETSHAGPVL